MQLDIDLRVVVISETWNSLLDILRIYNAAKNGDCAGACLPVAAVYI